MTFDPRSYLCRVCVRLLHQCQKTLSPSVRSLSLSFRMYLSVVFAWIVVCVAASGTIRHVPRNDSKPTHTAPRTVGYFGNWVCQSDPYYRNSTLMDLLIGYLRFSTLLYHEHSRGQLDAFDIFLCECQFDHWGGVSHCFIECSSRCKDC